MVTKQGSLTLKITENRYYPIYHTIRLFRLPELRNINDHLYFQHGIQKLEMIIIQMLVYDRGELS